MSTVRGVSTLPNILILCKYITMDYLHSMQCSTNTMFDLQGVLSTHQAAFLNTNKRIDLLFLDTKLCPT